MAKTAKKLDINDLNPNTVSLYSANVALRKGGGILRLLRNNILATDLEFGIQMTKGGIIMPDDNMTEHGIKPRWAKVYRVGPEVKDLTEGLWILVSHGRWSKGFLIDEGEGNIVARYIDYKDILVITDEKPGNFATQ